MTTRVAQDQFDWRGPASLAAQKGLWRALKETVIPPKGRRDIPTASGFALILIGVALGLAAYNTENNILFAALSLLVGSLIVSGVFSFINFRRARWRLEGRANLRVGERADVELIVENQSRMLPIACLFFDLEVPGQGQEHRLFLKDSLDPGESARLVWSFEPSKRCIETIRVASAVSSFPFGFIRRYLAGESERVARVWPRRISYQFKRGGGGGPSWQGRSTRRKGISGELIGLRQYEKGDSLKSIHWKVSARQGKLVVKQNAAEDQTKYSIAVDNSPGVWSDDERFELMCSFAATLAEDLFLEGRLDRCCVGGGASILINRVADLETFLDELAGLEREQRTLPGADAQPPGAITFAPVQGRKVGAFSHGIAIAQA